jgi:hypothetical protein
MLDVEGQGVTGDAPVCPHHSITPYSDSIAHGYTALHMVTQHYTWLHSVTQNYFSDTHFRAKSADTLTA